MVDVPSCALNAAGLERQRARYRRVAPAVLRVTRGEQVLSVDFTTSLDRQALEELIAVERECCPFFTFGFDQRGRRLEVGVRGADQAPALDAIATAFSAKPAAG